VNLEAELPTQEEKPTQEEMPPHGDANAMINGNAKGDGNTVAQEWRKRTLIGHEPLICNKICFT